MNQLMVAFGIAILYLGFTVKVTMKEGKCGVTVFLVGCLFKSLPIVLGTWLVLVGFGA